MDWIDPVQLDLPPERRHSPAEFAAAVPAGMRLPPAGERAALQRWREFLDEHVVEYDTARDVPYLDRTSRISPYLKWGAVHPRTLLADLAGLRSAGAAALRRELAFREFYADFVGHRPDSVRRSVDPAVDTMRWDTGADAERHFAAWCSGNTGFPYIDAGMRQLLAQGWMHNRVRMAVGSFLVKDLHLPWQRGARHFMAHLVDGDAASNAHGWQWVAGSGAQAAPFYRIFNPVGQGEKHDPDGEYVRRYVPELADITGKAVHRPWDLPGGPPNGYPAPIVDHAAERERALADWATRPR